MHLLYLLISLTFSYTNSAIIKNGIFDNVTINLSDLNNTNNHVVLIDFDDGLTQHISNKPSQIITIQNQFIPKLETNSIADLPHVENLIIVYNGIREIRRGTFKNLPKLKLLNLSHNAIEEVHQGIFNDIPVRELYLNNNKISRIGYKAFSHLNLKRLFLNNNRISRWSKDWFDGSTVRVLNMGHNLIQDLPSYAFQSMAKSADGPVIMFSRNQLKRINRNVFSGFEKIRRLSLDGNLIERLDSDGFREVKRINVLNLNNNSLTEINVETFRGIQVDVLMLEDNKLRCISTEIFEMEELDIDGNPITCSCVQTWLHWRDYHSNPSIYHITNLEQDCI